jgi:hypothetical protein
MSIEQKRKMVTEKILSNEANRKKKKVTSVTYVHRLEFRENLVEFG